MTVREDEPGSLHDPLEWLAEELRTQWASSRIMCPEITARHDAGNVRVEDNDWILLYHASPSEYKTKGTRHRTDTVFISFDIRTDRRASALAARDEVHRILERLILKPDNWGEWDQIIVTGTTHANDYATYQQIVIDIQLTKFARARALARALGG